MNPEDDLDRLAKKIFERMQKYVDEQYAQEIVNLNTKIKYLEELKKYEYPATTWPSTDRYHPQKWLYTSNTYGDRLH